MWLCTKHKAVNQESMEAKANQLNRDHGLNLVYLLGFSSLSQPVQADYVPQPHPVEAATAEHVPITPTSSKIFSTYLLFLT